MITYGNLRNSALQVINNPLGEGVEDDLILDAICAAHDAIMPWTPKLSFTQLTGDGSASAFDLPADFYSIDAVLLNATGEVLAKAVFTPGQYFGVNLAVNNTWILYPTGQIAFAKVPDSGEVIDLYYCATWTKPISTTQESDALEPPDFLKSPLTFYTAAYLLLPDASALAGIGGYKTRVDSGNPEHNPLERTITFLINLFNQEMNRHPKHQRSQV